ncbi:MAG: tail fiber protein, partial [Alphaproteobacteria bacterium]|nr:tail fiber protein [Alphaproteobacteria bacterium]
LRGRTLVGKDDMGGTAASRITSAGSGVDGLTLGAVGGSQSLHGHTHTASDSGHIHGVTDPGHTHTTTAIQSPTSSPGSGIAGSTGWTFGGASITAATTGISIGASVANVTNATTGSGASQNMPPSMVMNAFIYAGA